MTEESQLDVSVSVPIVSGQIFHATVEFGFLQKVWDFGRCSSTGTAGGIDRGPAEVENKMSTRYRPRRGQTTTWPRPPRSRGRCPVGPVPRTEETAAVRTLTVISPDWILIIIQYCRKTNKLSVLINIISTTFTGWNILVAFAYTHIL